MADDSELDYIRTFLGKVHTAATVKQIEEVGHLGNIVDATEQRILVLPGEMIASTRYSSTKRYKAQISETSEANLTTALNNIIIGIRKLNRRQTISEYTKPNALFNITLSASTKAYYNFKTKRWDCDIYLDIEWGVD